jgi:PKD repeat protein
MKNKATIIISCIIVLIIAVSGIVIWNITSPAEERPPTAVIFADVSDAFVDQGVQFSANGSLGKIVECLWDFGNGYTEQAESIVYHFSNSDLHNVTLTVKDYLGRTASASKIINVHNKDFSNERSGSNLPGFPRAILNPFKGNSVGLEFPVLNGTDFPHIKAVWRGNGFGKIWTSIGPEVNLGTYYADTHEITGDFDVEFTIDPDASDFTGETEGILVCGLICDGGEVLNYHISVEEVYFNATSEPAQ